MQTGRIKFFNETKGFGFVIPNDGSNELLPGDSFVSKLYVRKEGIKYVFYQQIHRKSDDKLCVKAKVDTVVVVNGKLSAGIPELDSLISE